MSMDLLDRLIADICAVTESLMNTEHAAELLEWQPASKSLEKQHASLGHNAQNRHKAKRPMEKGVHRSVC